MSAMALEAPVAAIATALRLAHRALLRATAPCGPVFLAKSSRRSGLGDREAEALAQERQLLQRLEL
jgi:hypothetical protein